MEMTRSRKQQQQQQQLIDSSVSVTIHTQTKDVAVYRLLTVGTVEIEMMEAQISKKKLERLSIVGGDFRKAGRRSRGEMTTEGLRELLKVG